MKNKAWPLLGCGVGLRAPHYSAITQDWPKVDWFEAISENYMDSGGKPLAVLEQIRAHYPVALHGVALSIGSTDPLHERYLSRLKILADRIQPEIISDHLCWSGAGGQQLHDLLPLPFTEESIAHVVNRVAQVQDVLKRPLLLENVSTYVTFSHSVMPEWEFLAEIAKRSGCGILLDINNIYVNAKNHGFDPYEYLAHIPGEKIGQFHLAGHTDMGTYLFDTHGKPVIEEVWNLYRRALQQWGQISTLVEWDADIPDWAGLMKERDKAKIIYDEFKNYKSQGQKGFSKSISDAGPQSKGEVPLKEVQVWMRSRIQASVPEAAGKSPLNLQGNESGESRVSIYAGGYRARIHEGLAEVYETVQKILGEKQFAALSETYAEHYPSHHYNLSFVGRDLARLIHEQPLKTKPFLEDLARLEWQIAESFHAFEHQPFQRDQLAQIPLESWERARLYFQPSVFLFSSPWPVLDLWKNRRHLNPNFQVEKKNQSILIGRKGLQVRCQLLDEKQYQLLKDLVSGRTLGEACEKLAETAGNENLPVFEWFSGWVNEGLIARCEISDNSVTYEKS